jgi:aminopeptidase N
VHRRAAPVVVALVVVLAVVAGFVASRVAGDDAPGSADATPTLKDDPTTTARSGPTTGPDGTRRPTTSAGSSGPSSTTTTSGTSGGTGDPSTVGAVGIGDPDFPELGNGGYDVADYHLALAYDPATDRLEGTATVTATATQALTRFDLDLAGLTVEDVTVDGRPATHHRTDEELVIDTPRPLASGSRFTTVVRYAGVPEAGGLPTLGEQDGWIATEEGAYTIDEPDGAHRWFPSNDHPLDRATFTVAMTVPDPLVAVASGRLVDQHDEDGRTTWTWTAAQPMAPYLLQVAVGDFVLDERSTPEGLPMRSASSRSVADEGARGAEASIDMIAFLETVFGPFPFETYGILVPEEASPQVAFESQTLALIPPALAGDDRVLLHELAHQWVGDSVALARWSDIWLNEGFATYAEWLWTEHEGGSLEDEVSAAYARVSEMGPDAPLAGDPGAEDLFDRVVYERGALTLQALRVEVGDDTFFAILSAWTDRHAGDAVTTEDFVALAEELSGRQLDDLFSSWLEREALPPVPR